MIILREPTTFDSVAHGDVAWVAEESKEENLDAREVYVQKPYDNSRARVELETSLRSQLSMVRERESAVEQTCTHNDNIYNTEAKY